MQVLDALDLIFKYLGPAVGALVTVIGILFMQKLKEMQATDKRIERKVDSLTAELPKEYIRRVELDSRLASLEETVAHMHTSLERWMERLEATVARKQDKD